MTTVIWIDWYSYHISRFRALFENSILQKQVSGIELVGGCGVHSGMRFRDDSRAGLPIFSLFPEADWDQTGQLTLAQAVWKKLNELKPSAVLVPGWYTAPALAAALWTKVNRKRSILMSESTEFDHRRVWWKETLKHLLIKMLFDYSVAGGKPHVRYLEQLGFPPERIARFYDVVDNHFYREETLRARQDLDLKRKTGLPESYFLYVGRLAQEKNIAACLRAFAKYRKQGGTWWFVFVGVGAERQMLEQLAKDLDIQQCVVFAGLKNSKETAEYYAFAGCFVLPSTREPWGLVVNEAMASALPVVVSNRCGCAEDLVLPGQNGYIFDPSNEASLTDCLLKISSMPEEERQTFCRKSLEVVADFSPEHWASEVARVVHQN